MRTALQLYFTSCGEADHRTIGECELWSVCYRGTSGAECVSKPRDVFDAALADRRYRELGHAGLGVDAALVQTFFRRAGDRILHEQFVVDRVVGRRAAREAGHRAREAVRPGW